MDARPYYDDTLHVQAYDSFYDPPPPQIAGDVAFYAELARTAGPLLEAGAGTGRVALALASAGVEVTGLDLSPAMLAVAADKRAALAPGAAARVTLVAGDMRRFALDRRFGTVIAPFRAFQCLLTAEDQLQALEHFRRHLEPQGRLVLHLFDPRLDLLVPGAPAPREYQKGVNRRTGRPVDATLVHTDLDPFAQTRRDTWRYREYDGARTVVREELLVLALRWTYRWEMRHLLALAGFRIEADCGDFDRAPPAYGKEMILVAVPR